MTINWFPDKRCHNQYCSLCYPRTYTTTTGTTYTLSQVPYVPKHRKPGPAQ